MSRGDGSLYKRGEIFWTCVYLRGVPHRQSTGTADEREARKILRNQLRAVGADLLGARQFTTPKACKLTVTELCSALRADFELRGKLSSQNASHLRRVEADFGECVAVGLTAEKIDAYVEARLADGDAKASINRATQLLNQCFALAIRRGHLNKAPHVRRLSEAGNERKIPVTETQLADFLAALPDDGLRDFAQWSAACAMRKGEASLLTWDMLHGDELRIPGEICKNRDGRVLPVTGELAEILSRRKRARRMDCQYIFHRDGKQVRQFDKSRRTAARKANLPAGFVFHTLRSAAATNLIHAGVPPQIALKVGGWKTDAMLRRYCILTTDDVRDALAQTEKYRAEQKKSVRKVVSM